MPNLCVANYTLTLVVNPVVGGTVAMLADNNSEWFSKEQVTANSGYVFLVELLLYAYANLIPC